MFTSTCPLKVQISQGLGPFFQIELLKTGRRKQENILSESKKQGNIAPPPKLEISRKDKDN